MLQACSGNPSSRAKPQRESAKPGKARQSPARRQGAKPARTKCPAHHRHPSNILPSQREVPSCSSCYSRRQQPTRSESARLVPANSARAGGASGASERAQDCSKLGPGGPALTPSAGEDNRPQSNKVWRLRAPPLGSAPCGRIWFQAREAISERIRRGEHPWPLFTCTTTPNTPCSTVPPA